jgi:hypothetical protein
MKPAMIILLLAFLMSGCVTRSTVTTYDKDGKITTITEVTSDVVDKITQSTKDKTVIIWEDGWLAYVSASPGTVEDPTPHGKIWGGRLSKGYMSIHKDHNVKDFNWEGLAKVIASTRGNLTIGPTGISNSNDSTSK